MQMQVGVGMTPGPNGPQMGPVLLFTPDRTEPQSYESHLETPEGVHVKVTYNTSNKAMADRYADELAQKSGWKVLEQEPAAPQTLAEKIGEALLAGILIPIALVFAGFIVAFVFHMAGYLTFNGLENTGSLMVRIGIWSAIPIALILSGVAIFTHSSEKQHD